MKVNVYVKDPDAVYEGIAEAVPACDGTGDEPQVATSRRNNRLPPLIAALAAKEVPRG